MIEKNFHNGGLELSEAIGKLYMEGQEDYTMEPVVLYRNGSPEGLVKPGDTVVSALRRGEREIEITELFTDPNVGPERYIPEDISYSILTLYNSKFESMPVAFPPIKVESTLAETLSKAGKTQLHAAESEKFAHVTFFFNGGACNPFEGEEDIMVPSPKDVKPETVPLLSLDKVNSKVMSRLGEKDFTVVNFANGDVIGHTACDQAKLEAAKHVSRELEKLVAEAKRKGLFILITADHGNIECMRTEKGTPHVAHTANKVAFLAIDSEKDEVIKPEDGSLGDVAPTILHLMNVEKPELMTGRDLLPDVESKSDRKVLLIILDGWGIGDGGKWDAIANADTPFWDKLIEYPHGILDASGEFVGLASGKPGNSEAGHMNLGAGRTVLQDDVRIDRAVSDGSYASNPVLRAAVERAKENGKPLHVLALLSEKSSHGCISYATEICRMAEGVENVYLHLVLDGRSTPPGSAPEMIMKLSKELHEIGRGEITSVVGRGIILDRDKNYPLVMKGYESLVHGIGIHA